MADCHKCTELRLVYWETVRECGRIEEALQREALAEAEVIALQRALALPINRGSPHEMFYNAMECDALPQLPRLRRRRPLRR